MISPFSKKRLQDIASGKVKVGRSTFKALSADEIRAKQDAMSKKVADALFGPKKGAKEDGDRAKARAKAWTQFSKFIRLRDADEFGMVNCATCPAREHWTKMDAGHAIAGRGGFMLFNEKLTYGQCRDCNRVHGGRYNRFSVVVDYLHGEGTYDALLAESKRAVRYTESDFKLREVAYALKVAEIKRNQPGKFSKP